MGEGMRGVWGWVAVVGATLALAGCGRGVDGARIAAPAPGEWLSYGRTYDEQRFSPLDQINTETVKDLGLAWWAEFDTDRGQEATPLVVDGVLYTTTAWSKVFAFDAATGEKKWSFDPKVDQAKGFDACCDVVNRGVAIWKGKVYVGTLDGRLIALNAKDGSVAWSVQTTDNSKPYTITGAPRVVKDKVLIGNGGAEYGVRGYITAYDAATGKQVWRFFTTPNAEGKPDGAASDKVMAEKAAATWSDGVWKQTGGGGTVWDAMAYDPELDLMYFGVGNGNPWNHKLRSGGKGDNLFLASILALRPDTGEYVWHYQTTPGETWDYTATQHIMLADLKIGGRDRKVLMQAPKNGFFYVLDRATGAFISAEKFVPVDWADRIDPATGRPVERPAARYPAGTVSDQLVGPLGGHNWHPMAFHPKTGLVYIPAQYGRGLYADPETFAYTPGATNQGMRRAVASPSNPKGDLRPGGRGPAKGELIAWDPVTQTRRWSVAFPHMVTSGVLATAGDLVFHSAEGRFTAYEAASGKAFWTHPTTARAIAPAMTYELGGVQHVALMVGVGGAGVGDQPRRRGRLLVFKLGGKAQAKPYPEPVIPGPLDLTQATPSSGDADAGAKTYAAYCASCHGAGPFFPDLTRSPSILDPDGFQAIVLDGALKANGMAGFRRFFGETETENLRALILWRARNPPPATTTAAAQPAHAQ
jgi:PQQ-dependent dehydrogenase (methanol/ethanol family)